MLRESQAHRASSLHAATLLTAAVWLAQGILGPASIGPPSRWLASAIAFIALMALVSLAIQAIRRGRPHGAPLALVAAPVGIALASGLLARGIGFDPLAKAVAGLCALAYFAAVSALRGACVPPVPSVIRPTVAARANANAPPLRWVAWGCLLLGSLSLGVLSPTWLAATRAPAADRALSPALSPARDAMVSAMALVLALVWAAIAGPRLLRRAGPRPRQRSRSLAMLVWAVAFGVLWWLALGSR